MITILLLITIVMIIIIIHDNINNDKSIHGVIVQLPLPDHISVTKVLNKIDPSKDVDCFTPTNVGKLFLGEDTLVSCTPK